jgi:poly(3-hydroxybutyrate) depolymerase
MVHIRLLRFLSCLAVIFMFTSQTIQAQLKKKYPGYEEKYYKSMRYGFFKPDGFNAGKSYPLIVYLHGSRDTVSRDMPWYQEAVQTEYPCFVLTPKSENPDQGWGNTWNEKHASATAKTLALVDSLVKHYNIDKSRLYLYGISMGGFGVFSVLQKEPGKFAAAYAICGGSDTKAADQLKGSKLWIFHGALDDIVPVNLSRDVYQEIVRRGGKTVRYTEYPGVRHNSWENAAREKTLTRWLFSQKKGAVERTPDPVVNIQREIQNKNVTLRWSKPDKEVWYYKVFRDSILLAELDGDVTNYTGQNTTSKNHAYSITAVNYFFKESKGTERK